MLYWLSELQALRALDYDGCRSRYRQSTRNLEGTPVYMNSGI